MTRFAYTQPSSVRHARVQSEILRRRILAVFAIVLGAVTLTMCYYFQSTHRGITDWRWFWAGELIVVMWLVSCVTQILTKTPNLPTEDYIAAQKWSIRNRSDLQKSDLCGCFYCLEVFPSNDIRDWTDDGETALCPKCGIDTVIGSLSGYPIQRKFLSKMHDYWF